MYTGSMTPNTVSEDDISTVVSAITPEDTIGTNNSEQADALSSLNLALSPYNFPGIVGSGHTFIIRSASCGRVLTLIDGQVNLSYPGSRGSPHWACVETKGWFGFRNPVSGKFLGYDKRGHLVCLAGKQGEWENFVVRERREGGHAMMVTNWGDLWYIGKTEHEGEEKLARIDVGNDAAVVWEFLEV